MMMMSRLLKQMRKDTMRVGINEFEDVGYDEEKDESQEYTDFPF